MASGLLENAVEETGLILIFEWGLLQKGRRLTALARLQEQQAATRGFCVATDRSL
jgi:hypothetical protein